MKARKLKQKSQEYELFKTQNYVPLTWEPFQEFHFEEANDLTCNQLLKETPDLLNYLKKNIELSYLNPKVELLLVFFSIKKT